MNRPVIDIQSVRAQLESQPAVALERARPLLTHEEPLIRTQAALIAGNAARLLGDHDEAILFLERAANCARRSGDQETEVIANLALGRSLRSVGRFQDAMQRIDSAYQAAEEAGADELVVDALNIQASIIDAQGEHQRALDMLNRARRKVITAGLGDVKLATIGTNIGEIHRMLGNHAEALEYLKDAYDRFKAAGINNRAVNSNLIGLGTLYARIGKTTEAVRFYEEARESSLAAGDKLVVSAALNNLAGIALRQGETDDAARLYSEALDMAVEAGSLQYQSDNLDGLGKVHIARHDMESASELLADALAISKRIGYRDGELGASISLATAQLARGLEQEAITTLLGSLRLAEEVGDRDHLISAHEILSSAYEALGDYKSALDHARRFHHERHSLHNEKSEERTRQLTVKFELERSNHQAEMYRIKSQYLQQARRDAEQKVLSRTRELEEAQTEIVTRLAIAAEYRDDDTGTHTRRVGRNAAAIGYAMGFPERDLKVLFTAARLHDVGKIGIPDSVLLKSGRLGVDEMELMRRHTIIGARILSGGGSRLLQLAENISLSHHERWDGKGYPHGLAQDDIPMAARIVAVSDVLDALTHARPYKPAWPVTEALAEIESQSGRQFDPDAVTACLAVFSGEAGLSPTDDAADWETLLATLRQLGEQRGFPSVQRGSVW